MKLKLKFETIFNGFIAVLLIILVGSVWASAQTAAGTNAAAATKVVAAPKSDALATLSTNLGVEKVTLLSFGLHEVAALQHPLLGNPAWKYLAFLLYIGLAWLASRLVDFVFVKLVKRWTAKTETRLDDLLVELMQGPIKVVVFVILLHVGLNIFDWPEWISRYFSKALKLVVAWSLTYMAVRSVDVLMRHLKDRAQEEDRAFQTQLFPLIRKTLKVLIILVAILVTAQNLDFNISSILASVSIGGLALGLAAQDTLANLFGAVAIFADKPFRVGDRIKIDSFEGNVETIGLRSTRIRSLDGHLITIPNKTVGNAGITNISRRPNIRTLMYVGLTYQTTPEKIQEATLILREVFGRHPMTHDLIVGFEKFSASSLDIQVVHWWKGVEPREFLAGMQEMNLEIKRRFDAAGIEFAYPTQTVHLQAAPPARPT